MLQTVSTPLFGPREDKRALVPGQQSCYLSLSLESPPKTLGLICTTL